MQKKDDTHANASALKRDESVAQIVSAVHSVKTGKTQLKVSLYTDLCMHSNIQKYFVVILHCNHFTITVLHRSSRARKRSESER